MSCLARRHRAIGRSRHWANRGVAVASGTVVASTFRTADGQISSFREYAELERRTFERVEDIDAGASVFAESLASGVGKMR